MKKPVEDYIDAAMEVLEAYTKETKPGIQEKLHESIPEKMKGYISSLGAAILMSGLVPAVAVYAAKESKADRGQVLLWVFDVLHAAKSAAAYPAATDIQVIFNWVRGQQNRQKEIERDILNASIALKLCIRTFELT